MFTSTFSQRASRMRSPSAASRSHAAIFVLTFVFADAPVSACAHGFGQRYDLPLPLWMFVAGAGVVVALSFLFVAVAMRLRLPANIGARQPTRAVPGFIVAVLQIVGVLVLFLLVTAGFIGSANPFKNIAPLAVWVIGWIGLSLCSAFAGDFWLMINPWAAVFAWSEAVLRRFGRSIGPRLQLPKWVGAWPAVFLFIVFAWCELIWDGSDIPRQLAWLLVGYSILTWIGMAAVGRDRWLETGEIFAIAFGLFARFAPIALMREPSGIRVGLRQFSRGLLEDLPYPLSLAAFMIAMLATVTFDGLSETPLWPWLVQTLQSGGEVAGWSTLGLLLTPLLLGSAFVASVALGRRLVPQGPSIGRLIGYFVATLLPISLAYHLAHNLSFLLLGIQYILPLLSDPFGLNWDLFGTARRIVDPSVASTKLIWTVALGAIVIGHVIAVYLAHAIALHLFPDPRVALRNQLPLILLMVCYTMLSLWILAQPITNFRVAQRVEQNFSAGEPGDPARASRTVEIMMFERDGGMSYAPNSVEVRLGEQIRFVLRNTGLLSHEFILATAGDNEAHGRLMEKFPEMEHDDPNGKRLAPGETSQILWKFTKPGTFEFACLIPGHHAAGMYGLVEVK